MAVIQVKGVDLPQEHVNMGNQNIVRVGDRVVRLQAIDLYYTSHVDSLLEGAKKW